MPTRFTDPDRQVVPRWRLSWVTARLGEMRSLVPFQGRVIEPANYLHRVEASWRNHRTLSFASDLVGAAFVLGDHQRAEDAAQFILNHEDNLLSLQTRRMARRILGLEETGLKTTPDLSVGDRRLGIRRLKQRLRGDPRNAFAWVDLAREHTILAQFESANHAIQNALILAPFDRFVLRAAVRFFLHWEDEEQAHDLLRRNPRTATDPWLIASEIAAAELTGRDSRLVRTGKESIFSRNLHASHTAELAGAIGTLELQAGANRQARRLFELALREPNENAIAQASWAARRLHAFEVDPQYLDDNRSFEASAWRYYYSREWDAALAQANEWQLDEPFASRPAVFGSFIASVVKGDPVTGAMFARRGLAAEPNEPTLLNNLAFSLASEGDPSGARRELQKIDPNQNDTSLQIAYLATNGLVAYREGDAAEGRQLYDQAIALAKGRDHTDQRIMGMLYQAREEMRSDLHLAEDGYRRALNEADGKVSLAVSELFGQLVRAFNTRGVDVPLLPMPTITIERY